MDVVHTSKLPKTADLLLIKAETDILTALKQEHGFN